MKQFYCLLFAIASGLISCNNDNKLNNRSTDDSIANNQNLKNDSAGKAEEDMEKKIEALKKLQPYTLEKLKSLLPLEMNGIKRKNYTSHSALGYGVVQAEYAKDGNTSMQIGIYDCAGEAGAEYYNVNYLQRIKWQGETDGNQTKTIDFMGGKAAESFDKNSNLSTLNYVVNDRLLIMMTGKNMTSDELKTAAQKMSFKI